MKIRLSGFLIMVVLLLAGCNTTKFVPDGEYLLDKVHIRSNAKEIPRDELEEYIRQTPNSGVFNLFRMQLGIYNLAGKDTSKCINRFWQRIGDPPVIYNSSLTSISTQQLQLFLQNKGFINAKVTSVVDTVRKKATVTYNINSNIPYTVRDYTIKIKDKTLGEIAADTSRALIHPGMLFDVDVFNAERERISSRLRRQGYYNFNKDFLTYSVDSALKTHQVDAAIEMREYPKQSVDSVMRLILKRYKIRNVLYIINPDVVTDQQNRTETDTVRFRDFIMYTPKKQIIKLGALVQNTFINPHTLFSDGAVERTYSSLNSLGCIKYVNITFSEVEDSLLDCSINIVPGKAISFSTEAELTFTDNYWGIAGNASATNRNLFKGAETLSLQGRMAYEWQDNVIARELGTQVGLKFPSVLLPFASYDFKRSIHANTEFTSTFNHQDRPGEFKTSGAGAGIKYSWNRRKFQHVFNLFNLSYVTFDVTDAFADSFLNVVPPKFNIYNYSDHFIMSMGYSGSYTGYNENRPLRDYSTVRFSVETAGNLLYGINHLLGSEMTNKAYTLFGVRYAQYVKGEYNVTHHQIFDQNNRFVYHLGLGLGIPFGNANDIPYEKRFFCGGANSVRGWSESTLGPGVYKRFDSKMRDFNQVGDIKLDMSMEYRAKLFWVMEGAFFLDAGNIWTIQDYETQSGGAFKLDSFLNQIAIAYGVGARFDFSFFIIRVDLGLKLFDPVQRRTLQWRILPGSDDLAWHLAIGYPF